MLKRGRRKDLREPVVDSTFSEEDQVVERHSALLSSRAMYDTLPFFDVYEKCQSLCTVSDLDVILFSCSNATEHLETWELTFWHYSSTNLGILFFFRLHAT